MINKIPLKSATTLLFKRTSLLQSPFDYSVLVLKRTSTHTFKNVFAFPGGVTSPQDHTLAPSNASIVTAHRQMFQQVGLFFPERLPFSIEDRLAIKRVSLQYSRDVLRGDDLKVCENQSYKKLHRLFGLKEFKPILRLISVPFLQSRYDTNFYAVQFDKMQSINYSRVQEKGQQGINNENLSFCSRQFSQMRWVSPQQILKEFLRGQVELAPPQFMIFNVLSSFKKLDLFFQFAEHLSLKQRHYPYMIAFNGRTKDNFIIACFPKDQDYPWQKILANEKDEKLREQLKGLGVGDKQLRFEFKCGKEMFKKQYRMVGCKKDTFFQYFKDSHEIQL